VEENKNKKVKFYKGMRVMTKEGEEEDDRQDHDRAEEVADEDVELDDVLKG